ncbi:MAG: DUF4403 family protein [Gemmatimonadaceae bacterium]
MNGRRWGARVAASLLAGAATAACRGAEHGAAPAAGASAAAIETVIPAPPPVALSRFDVPLRYDFTVLLGVIERVVPQTFGSLDSVHVVGTDNHKHYAYVAARGPFTAFVSGAEMHLSATLRYAARGYYKPPIGPTVSAGCGGDSAARPQIVVELVTPLTLTPSWHLRSAARLVRMAPASTTDRDRCTVSLIHYDVTERVLGAARQALTAHLPDIDRKIGDVDLTNQVTGWWALLSRPIRLTDGVWLSLQPRQLRVGRVTGARHVLTVQAGLDAYPKIVTGAEPAADVRPLPPLARDTSTSGFRILLEGEVDFATATLRVNEALRGRVVEQSGHTITIRSVSVSPAAGGRLALSGTFTGDASGALRLVGAPRFDSKTGEISVPDLDYDLATDSDLINAYAWLRSESLRDLFREKARLPVQPVLDRGRALLVAGLNRKLGDAVTLSANVDSVSVRGLYVTRAAIIVRAEASGTAGLSVRQTH